MEPQSIERGEKSQDFFPDIVKLEAFLKSKPATYEVEAKFKHVSMRQFFKLEKFFSESKIFERNVKPETTTYSVKKDNTFYMKVEHENKEITYQTKETKDTIYAEGWNFVVSKAKEVILPEAPKGISFEKSQPRKKERISFLCPSEKCVFHGLTIDITKVTYESKPIYEVEVERIDKVAKDNFIDAIKFIYLLMQGYDNVIIASNPEDVKQSIDRFFKYALSSVERQSKIKSFNSLIHKIDLSEFSSQLKGEIIQKYFTKSKNKREISHLINQMVNMEGLTADKIIKDPRFTQDPTISSVLFKTIESIHQGKPKRDQIYNDQFVDDIRKVTFHRKSLNYDEQQFDLDFQNFITRYVKEKNSIMKKEQFENILHTIKTNKNRTTFEVISAINFMSPDKRGRIDIVYEPKKPKSGDQRHYEATEILDKLLKMYKVENQYGDRSLRSYRNNLKNIKVENLVRNIDSYAVTSKIDGTRAILMTDIDGAYFVIAPEDIFKISNKKYEKSLTDGELYGDSKFFAFDVIYSDYFKGFADTKFLIFREQNKNIKDDVLETIWMEMSKKEQDTYKVPRAELSKYEEERTKYKPKTDAFEKSIVRQVLPKRLEILNTTASKIKKLKTFKLLMKDFYSDGNFYERVAKAFEQNLLYNREGVLTDGIVIQPIKKPYQNDTTLKWKPQITIDFRVHKNKLYVDSHGRDEEFLGSRKFPYKAELVEGNRKVGDVDVNGKIAEFKWDGTNFVPVRLRYDRSIPNKKDIAIDDWEDINNPVLESTMKGEDLSVLRKFNNEVKNNLLYKHVEKGSVLLDIGSGVGGDFGKWKANNYKVYAVEPDENNIAVMKERNKIYKANIKIIHAKIEETEKVTQQVDEKVDAVSAFFSLTFLQESETIFNNFIETVSRVLKPGGKFIGIVLDGTKVFDIFVNRKKDTYENTAFKFKRIGKWTEDTYGNKLFTDLKGTVTAQNVNEYLFFFDNFARKLKDRGIHIYKPEIGQDFIEKIESDAVMKAELKNTTILDAIERMAFLKNDRVHEVKEEMKEIVDVDESNVDQILMRQILIIDDLKKIINENRNLLVDLDETIFDYIGKTINDIKTRYEKCFIDRGTEHLPKFSQEFSKLNRIFVFVNKAKNDNLKITKAEEDVQIGINDILRLDMKQIKMKESPSTLIECLCVAVLKNCEKLENREKFTTDARKRIGSNLTMKEYEELAVGTFAKNLNKRWASSEFKNYKEIAFTKFKQFIADPTQYLPDTFEIIDLLSRKFNVNIYLVNADSARFYLSESDTIVPIRIKFKTLYHKNRESIILVSYNDGLSFRLLKKEEGVLFKVDDKNIKKINEQFYQEQEDKKDDYPYKRLYRSDEKIIEKFKNLQRSAPGLETGRAPIFNLNINKKLLFFNAEMGVFKYMCVKKEDYELYDDISYHFMEECIVRCKRYDQTMSSFEYWNKNKERIIKEASKLVNQGKYLNQREAEREILYKEHMECTTFKPHLMTTILRHIGHADIRKILDISAGWGDRLIGALAFCGNKPDAFYCGVDPNPCVHEGYQKILKFYNDNVEPIKMKVEMIQGPFESVSLPKVEFDAVISSPPYFDLEIYDPKSKDQSIFGRGLEEWFNKFLMVSLKKAVRALRVGGYLIININNKKKGEDYTVRMVEEMNKEPDVEYMGCLPQWTGDPKKSGQPFWIWKKVEIKKEKIVKITDIPSTWKKIEVKREKFIPVIEEVVVPKVTLIPLQNILESEVEKLQKIANEKEVIENVKELDIAGLKEQAKLDEGTKDRKYFHWAIRSSEKGRKIVGYIGLHPFKAHDSVQLRIFVTKKARGKGYARDALRILLTEIFPSLKELGIREIYAVNSIDNIPANSLSESMMKFVEKTQYYKKMHNVYIWDGKKVKQSLDEKLNQLTWKITKDPKHVTDIVKIIRSQKSDLEKLKAIAPLIKKTEDKSKEFIANKIVNYLSETGRKIKTITDIGGGNGDTLSYIGQKLKLKKKDLVVIENVAGWYEPYEFSNKNITYKMWNSKDILKVNADVVLIMVTLHHMPNETIKNLLSFKFKKGALIIIKEHDCRTAEDLNVINWEHHLYHLTDGYKDFEEYLKSYFANFKRKEEFDSLFSEAGFEEVDEFNRLFEKERDYKNPSRLYWKVYKKISATSTAKTYFSRSEYFDNEEIDAIFQMRGWDKYDIGTPTFVYEDGKWMYDKNTYKKKATIKNVLADSKQLITNKASLYHLYKKNMLIQYDQDEIKKAKLKGVHIVKPVGKGYYKGKGIKIIKSKKELAGATKDLDKYVVAKYLEEPYLYKNKKFHIRMHVIIATDGVVTIIPKMTRAVLALKKYKNDEYDDRDIHDTHFTARENTEYDMYKIFEKNAESVIKQMEMIVDETSKLFTPEAYPENKYAFEIFGYDFIVDKELQVWLMEINDKSGLAHDPEPLFNTIIDTCDRLLGY